jgi:hypothetical protein
MGDEDEVDSDDDSDSDDMDEDMDDEMAEVEIIDETGEHHHHHHHDEYESAGDDDWPSQDSGDDDEDEDEEEEMMGEDNLNTIARALGVEDDVEGMDDRDDVYPNDEGDEDDDVEGEDDDDDLDDEEQIISEDYDDEDEGASGNPWGWAEGDEAPIVTRTQTSRGTGGWFTLSGAPRDPPVFGIFSFLLMVDTQLTVFLQLFGQLFDLAITWAPQPSAGPQATVRLTLSCNKPTTNRLMSTVAAAMSS